jgi:hypothetical protein
MADTTTIQSFFTQAGASQFARDFLFRVESIRLAGIELLGDGDGVVSPDLVYAKTGELPGRNIEDKIVNYFGQEFHLPGKSTYPGAAGYSIEFYHDENCALRTKFEAASRIVFDNETSLGQYGMPDEGSVINLVQLKKNLRPARKFQLIGASIRDIGPIAYNIADGTGEVVSFPVTFAYHYYRDFAANREFTRYG